MIFIQCYSLVSKNPIAKIHQLKFFDKNSGSWGWDGVVKKAIPCHVPPNVKKDSDLLF